MNHTFPATSPKLDSKELVILIAFCEFAHRANRAKRAAIFRGWQAVWLSWAHQNQPNTLCSATAVLVVIATIISRLSLCNYTRFCFFFSFSAGLIFWWLSSYYWKHPAQITAAGATLATITLLRPHLCSSVVMLGSLYLSFLSLDVCPSSFLVSFYLPHLYLVLFSIPAAPGSLLPRSTSLACTLPTYRTFVSL